MLKKIIVCGIIILLFLLVAVFIPEKNLVYVETVISPTEILLKNKHVFQLKNITTFDNYYSKKNKDISSKLNITTNEAFILGNLAMYFTENLINNRYVLELKDDLIFSKSSYKFKLENSSFGIKNNFPTNINAFYKQIDEIRKTNYVIYDFDKEQYLPISESYKGKNFVIIKKGYNKKNRKKFFTQSNIKPVQQILNFGNAKIIISDFTKKLIPDRECSDNICKEILTQINNVQHTLDIAIYGYSASFGIEKALKNAQQRGVKIRLIYDEDKNGNNIYPDTEKLINMISDHKSDRQSIHAADTMHDKFYIFDEKIVITGSANLSHTDMSGFNSNNILVINSRDVAKFYKEEFEQMYAGKFHTDKKSVPNKKCNEMEFYFSPQDKAITNAILPLINNAKIYVYIPAFIITENRITEALINAKRRGIDVKIILDALSASNKYSKVKDLRAAGIALKTENWAGKMHSKTIIIDDKYLVLGSMNFSNSGERKNDENLIVITNAQAAKFYKEFFLYLWAKIPNKWLKYSARAESQDSIGSCSDGIDNDYDGLIDNNDEGCQYK